MIRCCITGLSLLTYRQSIKKGMPESFFLVMRKIKGYIIKKMLFIPWLKRIEYVTINVSNVNMFVTNTLCDKSMYNEHTL